MQIMTRSDILFVETIGAYMPLTLRSNPILPPEIWEIIAKDVDDKSLFSLAETSPFLKIIALRERANRVFKQVDTERTQLLHLARAPIKDGRIISEGYQEIINRCISSNLIPADQSPQKKDLEESLKIFATQTIANELIESKKDLKAKINTNTTWKEIDSKVKDIRQEMTLRALKILIPKTSNPQKTIEHIAICSARFGHIYFIKSVLDMAPVSQDCRGSAVKSAAAVGRLDIIELLLANRAEISDFHRGQSVIEALNNGHRKIVSLLLSNRPQICLEHREQIVKIAASKGFISPKTAESYQIFVREILEAGDISNFALESALEGAASCGHTELLQIFLKKGKISTDRFGQAVCAAAASGHLQALEFLLSQVQKISPRHMFLALSLAIKKNHFVIVEKLLATEPELPLHQKKQLNLLAEQSGQPVVFEIKDQNNSSGV